MRTISLCMMAVALISFAVSASAQGLPPANLTLAYTQSFASDQCGLIGKASVDVAQLKLPFEGSHLTFSADFLAIPGDGSLGGGFGASATIKSNLLGINVGIGWLPKQYGWSWNVTVIQIAL